MSELSFFQRYSQSENHLTNNTMLMLRYVRQHSDAKFQRILTSIMGSENAPQVGPRFGQQERVGAAIPDAVIEQDRFALYVETKTGNAPLDTDQIIRHLKAIGAMDPTGSSFLMGLAKDPLKNDQLIDDAAEDFGVAFRSYTFAELAADVEAACEGDEHLVAVVEDYIDFIAGEGLLPTNHRTMVAFPCGDSLDVNVKTGVYFQPASRNRKQDRASLVGLYADKCITHVGKISSVAICRTTEGTLLIDDIETGEFPLVEQKRVVQAIEDSFDMYGDFTIEPHRFYIMEQFVETGFRKKSKGGMAGHRYFDVGELLSDEINPDTSIASIAKMLGQCAF